MGAVEWFYLARDSLMFASNAEMRAIHRAYAQNDHCEFGRLMALVISRNCTYANLATLKGRKTA